ncbi:MAG: ketopantoate hydroxymethyltransferase [Frankiales bacterium]|nr:ketopantoate hydroxymethyltransferase [Frankiales bacterium]
MSTLDALPADKRVRISHLQTAKDRGERWAMLTSYDQHTARIFEAAGIPVLLVGDSVADNVLGYPDTTQVTVDEMLPFVRAVVRSTTHALVVADLPFGSYQLSPEQALATAVRFVKEAGAHAVKLEGGARSAPHIAALVGAGIPVMAHIGFTPQSVHGLGGFKVQGRGDAAEQLRADARAVQDAGAFSVVLELVPAALAAEVTKDLAIPTIGIGAGADCDAQVLVWTDMAGLTESRAKFVKAYGDMRTQLADAARAFVADVADGTYPDDAHSYE